MLSLRLLFTPTRLRVRVTMSTFVVSAPPHKRMASKNIDELGVPTIASSIPQVLLGFGLFPSVLLTPLGLFQMIRMAATGEAARRGRCRATTS